MSITQTKACRALVLKVVSHCNLNCDYCYMYNLGDKTYQLQPKFMPETVIDAIITKAAYHAETHKLTQFEFIFHGGEPLLTSPDFYEKFVYKARTTFSTKIKVAFCLQTNGILLTKRWCDTLSKLNINIGISLDGPQAINDEFRKDKAGKGSYRRVIRGLKVANEHPFFRNKIGVLTVINPLSDPVKNYEHLKAIGIQYVDFLFPDATHETMNSTPSSTLLADWLIQVFDLWFYDAKSRPAIRMFIQLVRLIIGQDEGFEYFGQQKNEFLVIETNGSIEVTGAFKICGDGFTKKGFLIQKHSIEEVLADPFYDIYYSGHQNSSKVCKECSLFSVCGGGFVAHRYNQESAFDNPSVYCYDLMKLITHIQNKVINYLPKDIIDRANISPLNYKDLIAEKQPKVL